MNTLENFVNADEAAIILKYHSQTIRKLGRTGVLKGYKRGRRWFFNRNEIQRYLTKGTPDGQSRTDDAGFLQ